MALYDEHDGPLDRVGREMSRPNELFWNQEGLRPGWAFLLFVILFLLLSSGARLAFVYCAGFLPESPQIELALNEGLQFLAAMLATATMAAIESRRVFSYGLADSHVLRHFLSGAAVGFASLTAMLLALRVSGHFYFGSVALHGKALLAPSLLWAAAFLMVAFYEEVLFRGYPLAVLAHGVGFRSAAIALSAAFGAIHLLNGGENWFGVFVAAIFGLVLCFAISRTGSLWWPIGFHAVWDYSESFVYSTPDSGQVAPGHLLDSHFAGPAWITGGSVGPEGSVFVLVLLAAIALLVHVMYPPAAKDRATQSEIGPQAPL
jgi:membrane protease YdiL (CAAX protease family)